jgi:hypothetical protein
MKQTITRILPNWHQDCGLINPGSPDVAKWAKYQNDTELLYISEHVKQGNATLQQTFSRLMTPPGDSDWQLTVEVLWTEPEYCMLTKLKFTS